MQTLTPISDPNRFDWQNHDGINRPMINDFVRNQFFDSVLKTVAGQQCVDIGFGTGLLSIMALKHGADHVTAYENNQDRFELGQHIITSLGLADRITLRLGKYTHQQQPKDTVIFSETVNGNLWGEQLWNSLPRQAGAVFIPSIYWMEIMALAVPDSFVHDVISHINDDVVFAPGVDIDPAFVRLINVLANGKDITDSAPCLTRGMYNLDTGMNTKHGHIPWQRLAMHVADCVASYQVDAGQHTVTVQDCTGRHQTSIDWTAGSIAVTIDTSQYCNHNLLLVPRLGLAHNQHRLTLDTGHWGPAQFPMIAVRPEANITVTHSTVDGSLVYTYT